MSFNYETGEEGPRTPNDLIRDLAEKLQETQWAGEYNTSCGCHPEYRPCCSSCDAPEYGSRTVTKWENGKRVSVTVEGGVHEKDCQLKALLTEAETLLNAEEARLEREHSGKTGWDHLLEGGPAS
jgi:hypothetical protein